MECSGGKGKERDKEPHKEEGKENGRGRRRRQMRSRCWTAWPSRRRQCTYKGSRECNANMEMFYHLPLVVWGESM
jgi:hypothetical protein